MKVQLIKPHTHRGIFRVPGDELDVSRPTAQWLTAHNLVAAGDGKKGNVTTLAGRKRAPASESASTSDEDQDS